MTTGLPLSITLPLPPMSLSKNARVHWARRNRDFQDWKYWTTALVREQFTSPHAITCELGADIIWRYSRGRHPDRDNAIARCAAIMDGAEAAGLFADDRQIVEGRITFERVKAGEEAVVVTFRKAREEQVA